MSEHQNKLIPALRFPEFKSKETWEERKLSDVLLEHKEKSTGKEEVYSVSVHKGVINQIEHLGRNFAASNTENYKRVFPGDIIYTKSPTGSFPFGIIKQSKVSKPVIVSPLYGVFTPETTALGVLLDAYFEYPARTINYLSSIIQKGAKNTINIHNDKFLSKTLVLPVDKTEQQKIASCLLSLDEVIAAHSQKLELLKSHKKGLMQNLFPQAGEKVPKYRFKEFENDGEWVEKKLGKLGQFLGGGTPSRANPEFWIGEIPWISSSDIFEDDIHNISISQRINKKSILESATKIIPKGSVLFVSRVGVGKFAINKEELCTSQDFTSFIPTEISNYFVAYYFLANKDSLQTLSQGTSIKGFSKSDLEEFKILYPKNSKEQQKIASCLSAVDALITAQAEKIEQLQLHKKGLMQGLFPKVAV